MYAASFQRMAELLLNTATCYVGGRPHRFTELGFYFTSPDHPDPFTHGDPMQYERGRWYSCWMVSARAPSAVPKEAARV
jgi:hypothetical protein